MKLSRERRLKYPEPSEYVRYLSCSACFSMSDGPV